MRHALVKRARSRARRIDPRRVRIRIARIAAILAALAWASVASAQTLAALSPPGSQPAVASAPPAQTLAALPVSSPPLVGTGRAHPTAAWTDFCRRWPAECRIDLAEPAILALTPENWQTLAVVNREVNERIKPMTDWEHWGVVDRWDFPDDGYGDCEDYQILKRKLLAERGLPRRPMRMAVVLDGDGNGHAVLMVRTDRGDFILDNQRPAILTWKESAYVFVKREGANGREWVSLETVASPVATATSDED